VPGLNSGWFGDTAVFAEDIRYRGQVICAVVGETEDIAFEVCRHSRLTLKNKSGV